VCAKRGREGRTGSLSLAKKPRVRRGALLLLAGVVFCCLGTLLLLPATASFSYDVAEVPSGLMGTGHGAGNLYRGTVDATVPVPRVNYPLLPLADEVREAEKLPVNAPLLTGLSLAIASFGMGALWGLAPNARVRGASRSWAPADERLRWAAREDPSFLGVFLL
jgi:hypothetical protein